LHRLQNRNLDAVADMLSLAANAPRSAYTLSLLSRAYSNFAMHGAGQGNSLTLRSVDSYGKPKNPGDGVKLAQRAANDALKFEPSSSAANLALGYALAALDTKAKNKREALAAWGKAAFLDPQNAANYLGLGYGIRYYASLLKDGDSSKNAEVRRAIATLQEAVKIRPNYYEAHRELAFCHIQLGDTDEALRECNLAQANVGSAPDANEVAGVYVAMAGLHLKEAEGMTGEEKAANEAASKGYAEDAKSTATDMKIAMSILGAAGVNTSLKSYLPPEVQRILSITPNDIVNDALGGNANAGIGGILGGIFGR
jgi:tetratricopeptide (TPR) repeat protein